MTALVNKGDETTAVENRGTQAELRPLCVTVDESLLAEADAPIATVSCFMRVSLLLLFGFPDHSLCSARGRGLPLLFCHGLVEDVVISKGLRTASYVNGIC